MDSGMTGHDVDPGGSGLNVGVTAAASVAASPADWEDAAPRVIRYLRALGVRDSRDLDLLLAKIRGRFEQRVATTLVANAIETCIDETSALLDDWLSAELGPDVTESARRSARAAVLSGAVHGWTGFWSGRKPGPLGQRIRACSLTPVPDPAPLSMDPQVIHPCCYRLVQRIAKALRVLSAGRRDARADLGRST
jgi:hypothetical protein